MGEKKKSGKGKTLTIVILILIILGLVGYIVYDKNVLELKKDSNLENKQELLKEEKTIAFDDQEAQKLLDKFGIMDVYLGGTVFDRGYNDDYKNYVVLKQLEEKGTKGSCQKILSKEIEEEKVTYREADHSYETPNGVCQAETVLIDYEDANKLYQEMFGNFTSISRNSISFQVEGYYYSDIQLGFIKTTILGGGSNDAVYVVAYKDAFLDEDILTIEVYHKVVNKNDDGTYTINDKKVESNEKAEQEILKNKDQMDIYKVIFVKEDDHFIFNRITQS